MSRLMDNLARIFDRGETVEPAKRPPLFLVNPDNQAPVSSQSVMSSRGLNRKRQVLLGATCCALLLVSLFLAPKLFELWSRHHQVPVPVSPQEQVSLAQQEGLALLKSGKFIEASQAFQRTLMQFPKSQAVRINFAVAMKEAGNYKEAEKEYLDLLQEVPNHAQAWNNLGALYLKLGRLDEARLALGKSLSFAQESEWAALNLASVHERQQHWDLAVRAYEEILAKPRAPDLEALLRERLRRVRSLAAAQVGPREKF